MNVEVLRSDSPRARRNDSAKAMRRADKNAQSLRKKGDEEINLNLNMKGSLENPSRFIKRWSLLKLLLAGGIVWLLFMLLVLVMYVSICGSTVYSSPGQCKKNSWIFILLDTLGFLSKDTKSVHRCPIPVVDDPDSITIPLKREDNSFVQNLSYVIEDKALEINSSLAPLFGGYQNWQKREETFQLKPTMKVHCGFIKNGGADMDIVDREYVKKCKFVVASGIFDGYDTPHQPLNISARSRNLFCFLMVVDEKSLNYIRQNENVTEDSNKGKWVGLWHLVLLRNPPYDEPRRNGKVPKILTHRLFPEAQYSIWIDGKMELIVDPLLILERYLWRGGHKFAIARHKHHRSIYQEADANKRRKRYARPLIDLHMKIYSYEGMESWNKKKPTPSDVPEGAVIIREHTPLTNLFCCLWFNEVNLFTPRDQLSFGYVVYRLKGAFKFFMFPNCEYNSLFILHKHTREHSSKIEWVKSTDEFKGNGSTMKESRGGLGLWTPYPANLDSIEIPTV
ncbi:probable hexosyltransferase MUCI70 isoform X2 [Cryptomeria japonica]|uniref:probable hexosyltransferase MUCI70 isoform X2 n=1 Tax=Cryptomeria japonica TaxID=3369 RepID=UPI0027DA59DC|nr:probable hexosyltransferase MUCI70 isoform X2 [Cryptomeria japonica]